MDIARPPTSRLADTVFGEVCWSRFAQAPGVLFRRRGASMSTGVDSRQQQQHQAIEQERRKLAQRLEEVARLCDSGQPPRVFYAELLQRLLETFAASAGAVWLKGHG